MLKTCFSRTAHITIGSQRGAGLFVLAFGSIPGIRDIWHDVSNLNMEVKIINEMTKLENECDFDVDFYYFRKNMSSTIKFLKLISIFLYRTLSTNLSKAKTTPTGAPEGPRREQPETKSKFGEERIEFWMKFDWKS